jgi:hypothetical protein
LRDKQKIVYMTMPDYQEHQSKESQLKTEMPNIVGRYQRTSDPSIDYNCLSWAVELIDTFLDPRGFSPGYSWPQGVKREWSVSSCRGVLEFHGYVDCTDGSFEEGITKVAVFVDGNGVPQHFARQIEGGKWTSKLGDLIDIIHDDLDCVKCERYGAAKYYYRKKAAKAIWPPPESYPKNSSEFAALTDRVLSVPKAEILRREAEYQEQAH